MSKAADTFDDEPAGLGHNNPPRSEILAETHASVVAEIVELSKAYSKAPTVISTDEQKAKLGEIIVPLGKLWAKLEGLRKTEKQPFLDAGREIDNWFGNHTQSVDSMKVELTKRATEYDKLLVKRENDRIAEERRKADLLAEQEREKAKSAAASGDLHASAEADQAAEAAQAAAQAVSEPAKAADLTRVRGGGGVVGTSRQSWVGEIVDIDKLDVVKLRPYLKREDLQKALNAYVRTGGRECEGAKIELDTKAVFR